MQVLFELEKDGRFLNQYCEKEIACCMRDWHHLEMCDFVVIQDVLCTYVGCLMVCHGVLSVCTTVYYVFRFYILNVQQQE